jgi:hypothetical protein
MFYLPLIFPSLIFLPFPSLSPHPFHLTFSTFSIVSNDANMDIIKDILLSCQASLSFAYIQVYKELMPDPKPARTCVGVAQLPAGGTDVEIEFVAYDG